MGHQGNGKIVVSLGQTYDYGDQLSVTVFYFAKDCGASRNFPLGISFVQATEAHPRLIQALSFPNGARHWFPCYDHPNDKATIEVIATVNEDYKALSNGKLVSVTKDTRNKTKTFHWMQDRPHSTYLTVLVAGPYHVIEDSLGDLPINYWVYPQDAENARFSFSKTPEIITFFNREFGYEYPWDKYDQVTIPGIGGGAECTSATLLGQGVIHDVTGDIHGLMKVSARTVTIFILNIPSVRMKGPSNCCTKKTLIYARLTIGTCARLSFTDGKNQSKTLTAIPIPRGR
jgi:aminopeptidase N